MKLADRMIPRLSTCITLCTVSLCFLVAACAQTGSQTAGGGGGMRVDKRKLTTVQTSTVAIGNTPNAVEVRYLNLPFGAPTFGYMEKGGDRYYSNRTWPIAHLKLATPAGYDGKTLQPGDYVFIITPKSEQLKTAGMMLSLASFKPESANGTFLKPGDVFTDTPKDAVEISKKPVTFGSGAPMSDQLQITTEKVDEHTVNINFHYGDRTHTETLHLS